MTSSHPNVSTAVAHDTSLPPPKSDGALAHAEALHIMEDAKYYASLAYMNDEYKITFENWYKVNAKLAALYAVQWLLHT